MKRRMMAALLATVMTAAMVTTGCGSGNGGSDSGNSGGGNSGSASESSDSGDSGITLKVFSNLPDRKTGQGAGMTNLNMRSRRSVTG